MITSFVSTAAFSEATRVALAKAQAEMLKAQAELASGRHADVGQSLGVKTAQTISMRAEHARLKMITDTNGMLAPKLEITQNTLEGVTSAASKFLESVIAARDSGQGGAIVVRAAQDALRSFTDAMNTTYGGEFLFSGINTDVKPFADYYGTPPSPNKQAVDAAFLAQFGFTQDDPAAATISATDMKAFIDGPYAALFDSPQWESTWSSSADQNIKSRISSREMIETSVNTNADPIRQLAKAYTMVADLGGEGLSGGALKAILDSVMQITTNGVAGVNAMRSGLGLAQERVEKATERMSIQMDIVSNSIGLLENVDPSEVSVRISALTTQIEASYSLTARLHQMSLVNYL